MHEPHPLEALYLRLGHAATSRCGALWCNAGRFTMVTFPNNHRVSASRAAIQEMLVECGKLVAVFCPAAGSGPVINEYSLGLRECGLARLQHQFRTHVRKHGGHFVARELGWTEMAHLAVSVHEDLAKRWKGVTVNLTEPHKWKLACATAASTPGVRAFGCLVGGDLAGYVVSWQDRDTCHGVLIHRNSSFDAQRVGNVLLHSFSEACMARDDVARINLGRSWFPPKPGIDSFKRHAGYEETRAVLAVVLHPRLERVLRAPLTHRCLGLVETLTAGRASLRDDLHLLQAARATEIP